MDKTLFSEFEAVSAKAFKQKIQFDLKGADYNETLIWHTLEGIDVKPFYHSDDLKEKWHIPGQPESWNIGEELFISTAASASENANNVVEKGTEALFFTATSKFDIDTLFEGLKSKEIPLYFKLDFMDTLFYIDLINTAKKKGLNIYLNLDIIGRLAQDGNWYENLEGDHQAVHKLLANSEKKFPTLSIDCGLYQNAGATIVQQLAYGLAHANEYLNHFGNKLSGNALTFTVSVGSNYFFEIAKIRALRILFATLAKEYDLAPECHIIAVPSRRNKVIYDYNTNMLRTMTECMSAILGGADTIVNMPYDGLYHKTNDFGQRISRNQLLILKEESYFDEVANPASGSYYIEELTRQLAEKALALFKDIEEAGGFLKLLKSGVIQRKIKESATKEQELFDEGKLVLLGTNKYSNPDDRMKDDVELYPFVKMKPRKTLIEPIVPKRLAEEMEKSRLAEEKKEI